MKISKRKILVSLTDEDIKHLDQLSNGYSRSATIATMIRMNAPYILPKNKPEPILAGN